jgi:hypothetical protein
MAYTEKMSSDERIRRALCCGWNLTEEHVALFYIENSFYEADDPRYFSLFCRCVHFHGVLAREDKARIFDLVYLGAWDIAYWLGEEHVVEEDDEFIFVEESHTVH